MKDNIINKMNEGLDIDVPLYTWNSIPDSLKNFWHEYFMNNK